MAVVGPDGPVRAVRHEYQYLVSDEYIDNRIDVDGLEMPKRWSMAFALQDLPSSEQRHRARQLRERWEEIGEPPEFAEPTTDPVEFLDRLEEWLSVEGKSLAVARGRREEEELRHRRAQERFEAEMDDWIFQHGSRRLRAARTRKYKASSAYAKERAMQELPGCWVDTAELAVWRERVDPTASALLLETDFEGWLEKTNQQLRTRIVWLVEPPAGLAELLEAGQEDDPFAPDFEQQEALLVLDYLGKYAALMPVDEGLRAPRRPEDGED